VCRSSISPNVLKLALYSEIIDLSGNCICYAPIPDIFDHNHPSFLDWWENEYKELDFANALDRVSNPIYVINYRTAYQVARTMNLSEDSLPCMVFFENHFSENIVVRISNADNHFKLLHTLRKVFSIVNKINASNNSNRIQFLQKELSSFIKQNEKRITKFPITLLNINLLSIKGMSIIDKLFGR
jgi:phenolic acid decarboxylase